MYNARYVSESGKIFRFGYEYGSLFDIEDLTGLDVDVSYSQGFGQIGETVENQSVGSNRMKISGKLLNPAPDVKRQMLSVFAPMTGGRLYFNERYYIDCVVKKTPFITVGQKSPEFLIELTAPYPFWLSTKKSTFTLGDYTPAFSFPVNYAEPHVFGIKNPSAFANCVNNGMVPTNFKLEFRTQTTTQNPQIIHVLSQRFLKLNTEIAQGETYTVYREGNRLKVEKTANGVTTDAFSVLDEDSSLFDMEVGDNVIRAAADDGEDQLVTVITFNEATVGVYEGL